LRHTTTAKIQGDRLAAAQEAAQWGGAVVVLKGAHTIVADPQGTLYINPTGNPGMATAGTGDVLSGMLGALLGQGYEPGMAARMAVYVHGLAGDLAAATLGQRAMMAGDVIDALPRAFQRLEDPKAAPSSSAEQHWIIGGPSLFPPHRVA
jgi:NAD(P)H-hydrate epimerase